jgi:hypothetical protein
MYKGLGRDCGHGLVRRLFGCTGWIFDQKSSGVFPTEVCQSSPNSLVAHSRQNQCYALAWGSCADFHCNEVSRLRLAFTLSSAAQLCRNVGFQTY